MWKLRASHGKHLNPCNQYPIPHRNSICLPPTWASNPTLPSPWPLVGTIGTCLNGLGKWVLVLINFRPFGAEILGSSVLELETWQQMKGGSGDLRVAVETEMEGGLTLRVGFRSRFIRTCNQRGTEKRVHMVRKQSEAQSEGTGRYRSNR